MSRGQTILVLLGEQCDEKLEWKRNFMAAMRQSEPNQWIVVDQPRYAVTAFRDRRELNGVLVYMEEAKPLSLFRLPSVLHRFDLEIKVFFRQEDDLPLRRES